MEIFTMDQGGDDWFLARLGIPTASMFKTVMAKGEGKTRKTYMLKLAGEVITGIPSEGYSNAAMERGHEMEGEARDLYAFTKNVEPVEVGFIRNGAKGCSPDALVGEDGMAEIKSKAPHLLIEVLERGDMPPEHKAQVQGALWVAERAYCDFVAYYRGMPLFVRRITRDEPYINAMASEVDRFNDELAAMVEWVRSYGLQEKAA